MKTKTSADRLHYLDWLRGLGAIIMLQGHVFDSFLKPELRDGGPFMMSQFLGGMPPAIFLFLTGVTLAFLMDSTERKGFSPGQRVTAALRRSGYLFFLAFAFRLQQWISGWTQPWTDLLRVDILNSMGLAIAVISIMALYRTKERVRLCAILGFGIAAAAPLVSQMNWSWLPAVARSYLVPDYRSFGFFPWAAYLAFGVSAGSLIRTTPAESMERMMQWVALLGGVLVVAAQYCANLPYSIYAKSDFWLNSPAQVLIKLGVTLLLMAFAFLWTRYATNGAWSWVRQFGTTSLLVYWVHIELVYGRWFWFFKNNLTVVPTLVAAVLVVLLMLAISTVKTKRYRAGKLLTTLGWPFPARPERIPAD